MSSENVPATPAAADQLKFHLIKSNYFRVVHTDGIWVSVHPNELIHISFFSERAPFPTETVYNLTKEGEITNEDLGKRVVRSGYVREMEVDVVLNRTTATSLHEWLGQYLSHTAQLPPQPKM
jgi:hypothetical protein